MSAHSSIFSWFNEGMQGPLEKDIQAAICDHLALKGVFFWRSNTPIFDPMRKAKARSRRG